MTKDDLITISTKQLDSIWSTLRRLDGVNGGTYSPWEFRDAGHSIASMLDNPRPKTDAQGRKTNVKTYTDANKASHMLGFLRLASQQRPENSPHSQRTATSQSLSTVEELIRSCAEPFQPYLPGTQIIPVYFQDAYLARPQLPVPFLIIPNYFEPDGGDGSEKQADWIGVGHEVGHYIYRQLPHLREELEVSLAGALQNSPATKDKKNQQRLWFHYLEETFADLIGVMSFGAAFVYSQHVMILSSALSYTYIPGSASAGSCSVDYEKLLAADDLTHPIPFIRGEMGTTMYECLANNETPDMADLQSEWTSVFQEIKRARGLPADPSDRTDFFIDDPHTPQSSLLEDKCYSKASDPAGYGKLSYYETIAAMEFVVDTILGTELHSLGKKSLLTLASGFFQADEDERKQLKDGSKQPKDARMRNRVAAGRLAANKNLLSPSGQAGK